MAELSRCEKVGHYWSSWTMMGTLAMKRYCLWCHKQDWGTKNG